MSDFAIRGNIIFSAAADQLHLLPGGFLVCEDGHCAGVFSELPERCDGMEIRDHGDALVIPGYTDLHLHASQFENLGLGMDEELLGWLEKYTYPAEVAFADEAFASAAYDRFTEALRRSFTTRAVIFATVHGPATLHLMEKLEKSGLRCLVGKVSMDRNSPEALRESSARAALEAVEDWLAAAAGRFENVSPVLTPRFVPSCSRELLEGLGALADLYGLPVQSHLSENPDEVAWVRSLHPECGSYADVYRSAGLLGPDVVMAHCVYLEEKEIGMLRDTGTMVAHCPVSNTNLRSGIAPVRRFLDEGIRLGLGSGYRRRTHVGHVGGAAAGAGGLRSAVAGERGAAALRGRGFFILLRKAAAPSSAKAAASSRGVPSTLWSWTTVLPVRRGVTGLESALRG